jgi:dipeptidase
MKNRLFLLLTALLFAATNLTAQVQKSDPWFGESCTSIMVGKKASADGSVFTSHTCDGNYRTWLRMELQKNMLILQFMKCTKALCTQKHLGICAT